MDWREGLTTKSSERDPVTYSIFFVVFIEQWVIRG